MNENPSLLENLLFEIEETGKAQQIKEKIQSLETYQARSMVVHPTINQVDVFSIISDETAGFVNYIKISKGAIIQSFVTEYRKVLEETDEEILTQAIVDVRANFQSISKEILTNIDLDIEHESSPDGRNGRLEI